MKEKSLLEAMTKSQERLFIQFACFTGITHRLQQQSIKERLSPIVN